jgi:hypothetical protein
VQRGRGRRLVVPDEQRLRHEHQLLTPAFRCRS